MLKPCVLHVRVTAEEFAVLTLVAKQRGVSVSRLVRERLFESEGAGPAKRPEAPLLPAPADSTARPAHHPRCSCARCAKSR